MQTTEATRRLGIRYPIVQGPFGGGLSTVELAGTVSQAGGLGSFGAHMLAPDRLEGLVASLRERTSAPFAVNLWVSDHDPGGDRVTAEDIDRVWPLFEPYFRELGLDKPEPSSYVHHSFEAQADALLEARPPVFSFVFGVPSRKLLAECARRGIVTVGACTTIAEARALEEAAVDLIVASGFEAGGHRPSFLARAEDSLHGTFALTQLVSARVSVPVIAAGGIADARGVRAALVLGAQAAQIGTAFLACAESGTTDEHRASLFDPSRSTVLTRAFSGRLARGIANRWSREMARHVDALPPYPVQSWFTGQLRAAVLRGAETARAESSASANKTELVSLWSGQIAPNLRHKTAQQLMTSLIEEI